MLIVDGITFGLNNKHFVFEKGLNANISTVASSNSCGALGLQL
jgi:hypothetical protein